MVVCGFQFFPCSHNHQLFEVNELSYEATDVESWSFVSSNKPVKNGCEVVYEMSLTKAVDMGHTWSKYGNGMGQPMTNVWVLYGFYMGH